jgi:hypothetical protein
VKKFLAFLDEFPLGQFSVIVSLINISLFGPSPSTAAMLLFSFSAYCFEKYEKTKKKIESEKSYDINMVMLQNQLDQIKLDHEGIKKTAEDTKKLLSQSNLAMGFQTRQRQ